jgi:D-glycero-alpha-D-manno-heptose-7-phosphate kinase
MYLTKSPMRVTFIGGGTDHKSFFDLNEGATISSAINKFVYVITNEQPMFVNDKFRFTYRKTESVSKAEDFEHPVVRETLRYFEWVQPLNISTMADLPGSSGLGSSSAFTAALYQNLSKRLRKKIDAEALAKEIIHLERDLLGEPGGYQDQVITTHGGLRLITYNQSNFVPSNDFLDKEFTEYCRNRLLLVRTKSIKSSMKSAAANEKYIRASLQNIELTKLSEKTKEIWATFVSNKTSSDKFNTLQKAIQTSWAGKKKWGEHIFTKEISHTLTLLINAGVSHFKLVGSGGGGFVLVAEEPEVLKNLNNVFESQDLVNFQLSSTNTKTTYYE